jgi:hypothetical protein
MTPGRCLAEADELADLLDGRPSRFRGADMLAALRWLDWTPFWSHGSGDALTSEFPSARIRPAARRGRRAQLARRQRALLAPDAPSREV